MTTKLIADMNVEELGDALSAQMRSSLDKRDTDLCTKIGAELEAKLEAKFEDERRKRAEFQVPGLTKKDTEKFQFSNILKSWISKDPSVCAYERDVCSGMGVNKTMTAGTDSAGGFMIPNQVLVNELIPLAVEESIAFTLGIRRWDGLMNSPVQIPKKTGASTFDWVGEAPVAGVTATDVSLGQMELNPHTGAIRVKLSNRLIMQSGPAVESLVREDMSEQIGLGIDSAVFNGSGVNKQPRGILQETGIGTVTSFGAANASTAYNKLIAMEYELRKAHIQGPWKWAMNPAVLREFQGMLDPTDGSQPKSRRLFESLPISNTLLGNGFETSTLIPTNDIILARWNDAGVGFWSSMTFRMSDIPSWANLMTEIMATIDIDVGIRRASAFCHTTGMTGATV